MQKLRYFRGFTLIELLVVIAIIAILASLVLSTAGVIQKKAARARAESEIAAIAAALESFKADNGDYPIGSNGNPNTVNTAPGDNRTLLVTNLMNMTAGSKVYFEFGKNQTSTLGVIDPFGEAYGYSYAGGTNSSPKNGVGFYDLWSRGGTTSNSNQIIGNW